MITKLIAGTVLVGMSATTYGVGASDYYKFVKLQCEKAGKLAFVAQDGVNKGNDLNGYMAGFDMAVEKHLGNLSASDRDIAQAVGEVIFRANVKKIPPSRATEHIRASCEANPENFEVRP